MRFLWHQYVDPRGDNSHKIKPNRSESVQCVTASTETSTPSKDENIAIFGSSLGAAISIYVASRRQDVAAVVSFASPSAMSARKNPEDAIQRFRDMGIIRDDSFPESIDGWASESEELSPDKSIENISPRPILLIHGTGDEVVPFENANILYSMAGQPKEMKILENVGHRLRSEPEALKYAIDWLKTVFVSNPLM